MIKKEAFSKANLKIIGNRLRSFRGDTSIRKFAQEMELTYSRIGYIESGIIEPTIYELSKYQKKFNVSYDYLLGLTDEPTTNINIKAINERYGLTEKSLSNLERLNNIKKSGIDLKMIDTINIILSEEINPKKNISLLSLIDIYLNTNIDNKYILAFQDKGRVKLYEKQNKTTHQIGNAFIRGDLLIKGIIVEIEDKLIKMKEGETDEYKGTGKK